jgi:voltage-gated potassium channel
MLRKPLTPRRAARLIVVTTLVVTLAAGTLMWVLDHREFPKLGTSMWWAVQTVTTVGYGDVVPTQTGGRIIGAVAMLQGIATISVVTAAATASLIEQARRRRGLHIDPAVATRLDQIDTRLRAIEAALTEGRGARPAGPSPEGPSRDA